MKFVPQSDQQVLGCPRRQAKRRNANRNVSALLSVTSSRWIALVVIHVKILTCASFSVFQLSLIWNSPNMSIAVLENGGNTAPTLRLGTWPMICPRGLWRNFWQITHFFVKNLAIREVQLSRTSFVPHASDFCSRNDVGSRAYVEEVGMLVGDFAAGWLGFTCHVKESWYHRDARVREVNHLHLHSR